MGWYSGDIKMARFTLVLDASVGVKWFSGKDESSLKQALEIRDAHIIQTVAIRVPDLFYYEVSNALAQKRFIPIDIVQSAVTAIFSLNLQTLSINAELLANSIELSRRNNITVYDACYIAIAAKYACPLVTANPRHQKPGLGCEVIPLEAWKE
jgi:predicted nucleic acid-binding protein